MKIVILLRAPLDTIHPFLLIFPHFIFSWPNNQKNTKKYSPPKSVSKITAFMSWHILWFFIFLKFLTLCKNNWFQNKIEPLQSICAYFSSSVIETQSVCAYFSSLWLRNSIKKDYFLRRIVVTKFSWETISVNEEIPFWKFHKVPSQGVLFPDRVLES